jgi:2-polyprenyl-6-methoxyphenol hydroxylase-like FAD-dependent oxidoreductase
MVSRRAVIVGAGIGGLTAAVALQRQGWDVTVAERASALEPVGAGLGLGPNALRARRHRPRRRVRRFSAVRATVGCAAPRRLAGPHRPGRGSHPVRRSAARRAARGRRRPAGGQPVSGHAACRCHRHRRGRRGRGCRRARVATSDGDLDADLVVAADGIGSRIRATLFPDPGPALLRLHHLAVRRPGTTRASAGPSPPGRGRGRCSAFSAGQRPGVLLRQRTRAARRPAATRPPS